MAKKKRKSLAAVVEDCAVLLQKLVRLKAADSNGYVKCVTCPDVDHWKNMQGGHFISRNHTATKLMEENIHPQCKGCNAFRMKDSLCVLTYEEYMIDMYGHDEVEAMKQAARLPYKHDRVQLEAWIPELREQIRELEAQL